MHNYESLHLILSRIIRTLTTIMIPGPGSAMRTVLANGIFWSNFGWSLNLRFLTSAAYCSTSFCLIDLSCFTNQFFLLKKLDFWPRDICENYKFKNTRNWAQTNRVPTGLSVRHSRRLAEPESQSKISSSLGRFDVTISDKPKCVGQNRKGVRHSSSRSLGGSTRCILLTCLLTYLCHFCTTGAAVLKNTFVTNEGTFFN